ncbi:hypothetical protein JOD46_000473 [Agromyces aurantiacus]|nr:hypothetical protein [Agromyces aurantiacus]
MFATMLVLGLISVWATAAAVIQFRRDGYRRTPTLAR